MQANYFASPLDWTTLETADSLADWKPLNTLISIPLWWILKDTHPPAPIGITRLFAYTQPLRGLSIHAVSLGWATAFRLLSHYRLNGEDSREHYRASDSWKNEEPTKLYCLQELSDQCVRTPADVSTQCIHPMRPLQMLGQCWLRFNKNEGGNLQLQKE